MTKIHRFFFLFASMAFSLSFLNAETFESQLANAKSLGFKTESFSHKSETIKLNSSKLKMSFPSSSSIKSGYYSSSFILNGEKIYLAHGVKPIYNSSGVDIETSFTYGGEYELDLTFYPSGGGYVSLTYKVSVPSNFALDQIPKITSDNFPVYPTGYFYVNNLKMANFDQQYFFNTAEKSWTLTYNGTMPDGLKWVVSRPGINFDPKNVQITSSNRSTRVQFDFEDIGVYQILLYDKDYTLLARWKVRNTLENESATPNKPDIYFDKNRSLDLAISVQDIPFEWEMNVDTLAKNLKQGGSNQFELNEIMFDWVVQNISYDHYTIDPKGENLQAQGFSRNSTYKNLFFRTCICADYSELSTELSQKMGLNDYYVDGPILMSGKNGELSWSAHAWNAVNIDNKWYYYDTTWNIFRHDPEDFQSTRGIDTYRKFWTDINYPDEKSNSSKLTISNDKTYIEKLPYYGPYSYIKELGLKLDKLPFPNYKVNQKKSFELSLLANPDLEVEAFYNEPNSYNRISAGKLKYNSGLYKTNIDLPKNGEYILSLSISNKKSGHDAGIEYLINANDSARLSIAPSKKDFNFSGNFLMKSPIDSLSSLKIMQKGSEFIASFDYHGIIMKGKIDGNLVVGTWTDLAKQTGWFSFKINDAETSLDGAWGLTSGHSFGDLTANKK